MRSNARIPGLILLSALLTIPSLSLGMDETTWIRTYRGGYGHSVFPTDDGGAMLGGTFGAGSGACCQPWLVKLGPDGGVDWHMTYEASGLSGANNIEPTSDGGYLIAGEGIELFAVKVDARGNVEWAKNYGDGGYTHGRVLVTPDDHYLLFGATKLLDNGFYSNGRVLKLDRDGNIVWQKVLGRYGSQEYFTSATLAYNGNYILAGMTQGDYWVVEMDTAGEVVWQMSYGGFAEDTGLVVTKVLGKYYLVVGASDSFAEGGQRNWWAILVSQNGRLAKQLSLGGLDAEDPHTAIATSDGGFMIGGGTGSFGSGFSDLWLVKFDSHLRIEWQRTYGSSWRTEHAWQIHELDTGYAVIGDTYAFPTDYDIWLMHLDPEGQVLYGDCGSVEDTSVTPTRTRARGETAHLFSWDTDLRATPVKIAPTPLPYPIESCGPLPEAD